MRAHAIRRGLSVVGSEEVRSSARNAARTEGRAETVDGAGAIGRSAGGGQQESATCKEVRGAQQPWPPAIGSAPHTQGNTRRPVSEISTRAAAVTFKDY